MQVRHLLWLTLFCVFLIPRAAHGGWLDIIWEMSGPQLVGIPLQCEIDLPLRASGECALLFVRFGNSSWTTRESRPFWLMVDPGVYFSTGKNVEDNGRKFDFRFNRARMIGLDLMVGFKLDRPGGSTRVYSAVGVSLNRFVGADVDDFNNFAFKFRPLAVDRQFQPCRFSAAYNLRLYPKGFDVRDRPSGAALALGRDSEWVHGISIGLTF